MGLHIGIVGGGFVGRVHVEALLAHPDVDRISIADRSRPGIRKFSAEIGD